MMSIGFGAPTTAAVWLVESERSRPLAPRPRRPDCDLRILVVQQADETHGALSERVARRLLGLERIHCSVRYVALFCGRAGDASAARARRELALIALRAMGSGGQLHIVVDGCAGEAERGQALLLLEALTSAASSSRSAVEVQFETSERGAAAASRREPRC